MPSLTITNGPAGDRLPAVERLGGRLIQKGLITPEQLEHALSVQSRGINNFNYLGEILISLGYVPSRQIGALLEENTGTPHVDLATYPIDPAAARLLPEEMLRQCLALPVRVEADRLWVAMEDPQDGDAIEALERHTGKQVVPLLAMLGDLLCAVDRLYNIPPTASVCPASAENGSEETSGIVRLHIDGAVTGGPVDIRIEPLAGGLHVSYRVAGVLHEQRVPFDGASPTDVSIRLAA